MKTYLAAAALAAAISQPAWATTFPTLTTIYVGSGVRDDGGASAVGIATAFNCSNVSGILTTLRFLVLDHQAIVRGNVTFMLANGSTRTVVTHPTLTFTQDQDLDTGPVAQGVINIESTQSGVFCNAMITDAADAGQGMTLPLVRVNPHPGTVE